MSDWYRQHFLKAYFKICLTLDLFCFVYFKSLSVFLSFLSCCSLFSLSFIHADCLLQCVSLFKGSRASVEDRSKAASNHLQAADCRDHWGKNLPQVIEQLLYTQDMNSQKTRDSSIFLGFCFLSIYLWESCMLLTAYTNAVLVFLLSHFSVIEKLSCNIKWPIEESETVAVFGWCRWSAPEKADWRAAGILFWYLQQWSYLIFSSISQTTLRWHDGNCLLS